MKIIILGNRKVLKIFFIIASLLLLSYVTFLVTVSAFGDSNKSDTPPVQENITEIKVLIFAGGGVTSDSVNGLIYVLEEYNHQNNTNKIFFNYSLTDQVNSRTLSSQDLLIIPGGDFKTYLHNPNIKGGDIKNFVSGGKGFVGICAGAFAASSYIEGYQAGWGIAPHVHSKFYSFDGELPVSFTSRGQSILNFSGVKRLSVANGPSMYKEGLYTPLARYNTSTMHNGYAAILDDTYGSGRVILSSPHPELYPQEPRLLVNMILWASGKT